jgi:tetratricopeptide (TPR) repeat protein
MTIDLSKLWNFSKPELSEQRFRDALATATGEDALVLQTQIARTYGLRGDFARAQQVLAEIEPQVQVQGAGYEAKVRYFLELGRTYASTAHSPESQTAEAKEQARTAYLRAFELAEQGKLDNLAIDALHMMTMVDTAPEDQLEWNRKAVAYMDASTQPEARKWESSLHNNTGYALYLLGRYEEALAEFNLALEGRIRSGDPGPIRIAYWMIAWTLRAMGRLEEALEIQLRLEKECEAAGEPDPYVFEELEHLYRALGDGKRADFYAERRKAST